MKSLKLTNLEKMQQGELQEIRGGKKHIGKYVTVSSDGDVTRCYSWCANNDRNTRSQQARWNHSN